MVYVVLNTEATIQLESLLIIQMVLLLLRSCFVKQGTLNHSSILSTKVVFLSGSLNFESKVEAFLMILCVNFLQRLRIRI